MWLSMFMPHRFLGVATCVALTTRNCAVSALLSITSISLSSTTARSSPSIPQMFGLVFICNVFYQKKKVGYYYHYRHYIFHLFFSESTRSRILPLRVNMGLFPHLRCFFSLLSLSAFIFIARVNLPFESRWHIFCYLLIKKKKIILSL